MTPLPRVQLPNSITFQVAAIRRALTTLTTASSTGTDGLFPRVPKSFLYTPGGDEPTQPLLTEFTSFINTIVDGRLPTTVTSHFASGTLVGIENDKSNKIRPLALGLVIRRFIARLLAPHFSRDTTILDYLQPHQFCVGIPSGGEALIYSLRAVVDKLRHKLLVVPSIDASNSFWTRFESDALH